MSTQLDPGHRLADYATSFDFMAKLSSATTERGVVEKAFDLFAQIFAPRTMVYISVRDGSPRKTLWRSSDPFDVDASTASMLKLQETHIRTPSGEGFDLSIGLGPSREIFRIEGVSFVEYLDHYLNLALDVAPVLALALTNARNYQAVEEEEARQRFIAEAGIVLSATLDVRETLTNLTELVVGKIADLCIIDLVESDGLPVRLKVAHSDPAKEAACRVLEQIRLDSPSISREARETRRSTWIPEIGPKYLESVAQSPQHLEALRELDPKSVIVVPILLHEKLLGTLALASSSSSRPFERRDLLLAEELARRAAFALEHARLYEVAQHATRARDEVLSIVAHDLRNPLGSIVMATKLLRRPGPEPERRNPKPTDAIERAAIRMKRLIDDLLDVTRVEAGRLGLACARVPAELIVADAATTQTELAAGASLDLATEVPDDLPDVWADRDRLRQVLENLVGNAVKSTAAGGRIVIGAARSNDADVLFWVKDTGSGIAAEHLPHLFDRFWQARKGDRLGAGLGLPIAKGIVEAHGGRIWVESAPARGSTFFFTIPARCSPG